MKNIILVVGLLGMVFIVGCGEKEEETKKTKEFMTIQEIKKYLPKRNITLLALKYQIDEEEVSNLIAEDIKFGYDNDILAEKTQEFIKQYTNEHNIGKSIIAKILLDYHIICSINNTENLVDNIHHRQ